MKNTTFKLTGLTLLVLGLFLSSCKKSDLEIDVPVCMEDSIQQIKNNPVTAPPTQVWEWAVDGTSYYYITLGCCDLLNYLYDGNCDEICAPDGGFSGAGDGNCPQFNGQIAKTLIWTDDR